MKGIVVSFLILTLTGSAPVFCTPTSILFDTDFASDCDDVGAVAILHALADQGEARILGMAVCTANRWSPVALDAVNTYYGRPNIPIGAIKGKIEAPHDASAYAEYLAKHFPNDLRTAENVPDAVGVYRRILAAQADHSVTFVSVGWLTNLRNLLESSGDGISPLTGVELVRSKVKVLVDMGPKIEPPGKGWNIEQDPASARLVIHDWPTPIVFSPKEICWAMTGGRLTISTPEANPVRKAYELWFQRHGRGATTRHSADLTAVLYAVRGLRNYWTQVNHGHLEIREDGYSEWQASPDSDQSYLVRRKSFEELADVLDGLMIRPPNRRTKAGSWVHDTGLDTGR